MLNSVSMSLTQNFGFWIMKHNSKTKPNNLHFSRAYIFWVLGDENWVCNSKLIKPNMLACKVIKLKECHVWWKKSTSTEIPNGSSSKTWILVWTPPLIREGKGIDWWVLEFPIIKSDNDGFIKGKKKKKW